MVTRTVLLRLALPRGGVHTKFVSATGGPVVTRAALFRLNAFQTKMGFSRIAIFR